jgi:DNA invertase Pin-like site-specific DNA recombinase
VRDEAAYLRVSTPQQSEAMQRDAIERAAAARGVTISRWFAEKRARDGKERPELDSVRHLARRGELGQLWVFKLDRLACGAQYLLSVVNELDSHGCRVVSIHEQIDTKGPWRDAILAVLGVAAQLELEAIRERMASARRKAERAGKRWGRPPAADLGQELFLRQLVNSGLTLRSAAKQAGLSYGVAQRLLSPSRQAKKAND